MSEKSKIRITGFHFNKGKEYVSRGSEANKVEAKEHELIFDDDADEDDVIEAKQHDLLFDDDTDEEEDSVAEANTNEVGTPSASNAETSRKMYEDEGADFNLIIAANKANTGTVQAQMHELEYDSNSDEEDDQSVGLEVHAHELGKPNVEGLLDFSFSEEEDGQEALQIGDEAHDENESSSEEEEDSVVDEGNIEEQEPEAVVQQSVARASIPLPEGMIDFSFLDEEGEDPITSTEVQADNNDHVSPDSDLTEDRQQLMQAHYREEGILHFSDEEDDPEPQEQPATKGKDGVMTRNAYKDQGIEPEIPVEKPNRRKRKTKTKKASEETTKADTTAAGISKDEATTVGKEDESAPKQLDVAKAPSYAKMVAAGTEKIVPGTLVIPTHKGTELYVKVTPKKPTENIPKNSTTDTMEQKLIKVSKEQNYR